VSNIITVRPLKLKRVRSRYSANESPESLFIAACVHGCWRSQVTHDDVTWGMKIGSLASLPFLLSVRSRRLITGRSVVRPWHLLIWQCS
jgi:hypothetical protein